MYQDNICSLCIVVHHKNSGTPYLFRIADVTESVLTPFTIDSLFEYEYENIDLIFHPSSQIPAEGSIGFWDWHFEEARRQLSYSNKTNRWIEYVKFSEAYSVKDIVSKLCSGIEGIDTDHDYLFGHESTEEERFKCVYMRGSNFQKNNNTFSLKNDIYKLELYEIAKKYIYEIKTDHLPLFHKWYYSRLELGTPIGFEYTKSTDSIIKGLILGRINTYVSGGKNEKAAVRNFLNQIPENALIEVLSNKLECSKSLAQSYINKFLETCESYINCEDYDAQILTRLINYNAEISRRFKAEIHAEWERNHELILKEAKQKITDINEKLASTQAEDTALVKCLQAKREEITALENQHQYLLETSQAIKNAVREQINLANQDVANFFSQYSMFMPQQLTLFSQPSPSVITYGKAIDSNPETLTDINVLFDCLQDNLLCSGVGKEFCKALAAYILAAYISRTPLIFAGFGADFILHALSATLTNKTIHQIFDVKQIKSEYLNNISDKDIVVVYNTLDMLSMQKILIEKPFIYTAYITSTFEELFIEPKGIYNYALPILSECFMESAPKENVDGFISNLTYTPLNAEKRAWLPKGLLPVYAKTRFDNLTAITSQIYPDITHFELTLLQSIPPLLLIGGFDETSDYISNLKLSDNEKRQLLTLIGERNV